jgi:hypothetical protein
MFFAARLPAAVRGLLSLVDPATGLPYDVGTITVDGVFAKDTKTSPTNIGLYLAALVAARDQGIVSPADAEASLTRAVDTLRRMERWQGFYYNWYDIRNLTTSGTPSAGAATVGPEAQRFVSSVDNANLSAALMVCATAFPGTELAAGVRELLQAQDYEAFYREVLSGSKRVPRMSHGYFVDGSAFSPYDYGTFMTEARMLVFLALAQNQVPEHPWAWSGSEAPGYMEAVPGVCQIAESGDAGADVVVIRSWGGSLFEELFPDVFIDERRVSPSLSENHRRAVAVQIYQRNESTGLWGWSPAQGPGCVYKEAGVACLASGPGYPQGDVSPYSILLAARYAPEWAVLCLSQMEALVPASFDPTFGYCDSVAQDASRYCSDILALDRGIEVLALCQVLQDLRGEPSVSQYLWSYLDETEAGARGRELLANVAFDPSWQLLPGQ